METPSVETSVWLLAAVEPILVIVAVMFGWRADQFGKVFIAAIVAFAASVLVGALLTGVGIPWTTPVGRDYPTLYPVRAVSAFLWAAAAFGVRRLVDRRR